MLLENIPLRPLLKKINVFDYLARPIRPHINYELYTSPELRSLKNIWLSAELVV